MTTDIFADLSVERDVQSSTIAFTCRGNADCLWFLLNQPSVMPHVRAKFVSNVEQLGGQTVG